MGLVDLCIGYIPQNPTRVGFASFTSPFDMYSAQTVVPRPGANPFLTDMWERFKKPFLPFSRTCWAALVCMVCVTGVAYYINFDGAPPHLAVAPPLAPHLHLAPP